MAIISQYRGTITACPLLISFGNGLHFSTGCFFLKRCICNGLFKLNRVMKLICLLFYFFQTLPVCSVILNRGCSLCLSDFTLWPSITLSANYPSVPITISANVFARPFIFISTAVTYQLAIPRETVITCAHVFCIQLSGPLQIIATLLIPTVRLITLAKHR